MRCRIWDNLICFHVLSVRRCSRTETAEKLCRPAFKSDISRPSDICQWLVRDTMSGLGDISRSGDIPRVGHM